MLKEKITDHREGCFESMRDVTALSSTGQLVIGQKSVYGSFWIALYTAKSKKQEVGGKESRSREFLHFGNIMSICSDVLMWHWRGG